MNPRELREHLTLQVSGAQEFRSRKASEYPDDKRNERSAEALAKLETKLAALPDDHPILNVCAALLERLPDDAHNGLVEDESQFFGRYGFDAEQNADAEEFIESYLKLVKGHAERVGITTVLTSTVH